MGVKAAIRRWPVLLVTCIVAAGMVSLSSAPFAVASSSTIGSTFAPDVPNSCFASGRLASLQLFQTGRADGTSYAVPHDGVITSWSFQASGLQPANVTLRVFRKTPLTGPDTFTPVAEDGAPRSILDIQSQAPQVFPTRIVVKTGDLIGLRAEDPGGICASAGGAGDTYRRLDAAAPTAIGAPASYTATSGLKIDVAAKVEPDADGDGFGDDTQDACPGLSTTQAPCPVHLADGSIRTAASALVGDGIYNTTATGQTVTAKKKRATKATFFVNVQNDGDASDDLALAGEGRKRGFAVRYFAGTADITSAVVGGTYRLNNLAPGQQRVIRLVVMVKARARRGALRSWTITTSSTGTTTSRDTVKANVKVRR